MDKKSWLIISFYTKNTPYEGLAKELEANLLELDLPFEFHAYKDLGSWLANCNIKPNFISAMMDKYPDRNLLFLDVDTKVISNPFIDLDFDIGMHNFRWIEYLTGVVYLQPTNNTRCLVDIWMKETAKQSEQHDQKILNKIINSNKYKLKIYNLPKEFVYTRLMHGVKNPIMIADFASTRYKTWTFQKESDNQESSDAAMAQ